MASSFDFDTAPSPPEDYTPSMQWNHSAWKKVGGEYVATREVREAFLDCRGFWPTLPAPALLAYDQFVKFCYHASQEEHQADEAPFGYIPIDFEDTEEDRRFWKEKREASTVRRQYQFYQLEELLFPEKFALNDESKRYLKAVTECNLAVVRELFEQDTQDLDPNCYHEDEDSHKSSILKVAMENLYLYQDCPRQDALEILRLVCTLPGLDVSMDGFYGRMPPIVTAIQLLLDVEVTRILVEAGAKLSFPDCVTTSEGQWCNAAFPPFPEDYPTTLHSCVLSQGAKEIFPHHATTEGLDADMKSIMQMLLQAGVDPLVKTPTARPCKTASALELLKFRQEENNVSYPQTFALLNKAVADSGGFATTYTSSTASKVDQEWATILNLPDTMQRAIAEYMDVVQWRLIRQTCSSLTLWPKPPPPKIDYQLISFMVSNNFDQAYYGVAKTGAAVMEACQHIADMDSHVFEGGYACVHLEFIRFDASHRIVPLLVYEDYQQRYDPQAAEIHWHGRKFLGVESAIDFKAMPKDSPLKWMHMWSATIWPNEDGVTPGEYMDVLLTWCDGMQPTTSIDLSHVGTKEGISHDGDGEKVVDVWLNPDWFPDKNSLALGGIALDPNGGQWAVFDRTATLWDRY